MPTFSDQSKQKLLTLHPDLIKVMNEVIKHIDCVILCGHRSEAEQNKAVADGVSKLKWPKSKHNSLPSRAVDVIRYPIDWPDTKGHYLFAGFVMGTAKSLGVNLRFGGDWNKNFKASDEDFLDLVHFELI